MQPVYTYLLKVSVCLALGYVFYFALLRRMTYYQWNRYYLLLFPLFALFVPVLPFYQPDKLQVLKPVFYITANLPAVNTGIAQDATGSAWILLNIVTVVFIAGVAFFLLRFVTRFFSLRKTSAGAILLYEADGIRLYNLPGVPAPFSFGNNMYLPAHMYTEEELQDIVAHEMVHVTQKHTFDMMASELMCIVLWFNPFVWMIRKAVKQNLEFIADDQVLQTGADRKNYQYLLLKVSGAMPHSLANNLVFPSLKKRIHMMNRKKTSRVHLIKFLCVVPLACLLLLAFSGPGAKPAGPRIVPDPDAYSLENLSFYINDAHVAAIVKKEQAKSLLKAGGKLSLSLLNEEKTRLTRLLQKNGYENLNAGAITFVMDSSSATRSFSIRVSIQIDQNRITATPSKNNVTEESGAVTEMYPRFIKRVDEERPENPPAYDPAQYPVK